MANDYYQPISNFSQNPIADDAQTSNTGSTANTDPAQTNTATPTEPSQQSAEQDTQLLIKKVSEKIADDLGFKDASEEQKKKILDSVNQRVETAVLKAIIANCPPETAKMLGEKIANETVNEQDIEKVIKDNPGLQEKIENEVGLLYEKMLEESKQVWQGLVQEKDNQTEPTEAKDIMVTKNDDSDQPPITKTDEAQSQNPVDQGPGAELSLADKIKVAGVAIDQKSVAEKIYQMRIDGEVDADLELAEVPEAEHAHRLSQWDWNKAGEIVKELEETQKTSA